MKFSVNWLHEFVDLPTSADAVADLLTMSGIEIERIETRGADFDNVVVGQITASRQHPNADRLTVCEVDDGTGVLHQIVCGAKNYRNGNKVPLALPGAELAGGLKIRASKLRGVESEGMLCSPIELGLGEDASGLLILSDEARVGAPLRELFPSDTIFDVEMTPNRGDLLSHFGLAREISALLGQPLRLPGLVRARGAPARQRGIILSAPRECPFFSLRRIENVTVAPSPDWLRAKIESVGIRSINNIVDISNFVMLELGQPTHAFDADELQGDINVRLARDSEKFLALDGRTYSLTPENLVIADAERALSIAGVMGGEETGVSASTKTVLLESAYFLPSSVRRTARNLNLSSDASYRFERGIDPQMILPASQRVTELICEIAGGTATETISVAGELPPDPPSVSLDYAGLDRLLGTHIEPARADLILRRFGLTKEKPASWKIPSYRRDLRRPVDLIEEVICAYGIEKVPIQERSRLTPLTEADRNYDFEAKLRQELIALGLTEARTSALIGRGELARGAGALEVRNPLSEDHVALRTSLLPGLVGALARNVRAGAERVALFEIGNVFAAQTGQQKRMLGLALNGQVASHKRWRAESNRHFDLFDLKGVIEAISSAAREDCNCELRRIEREEFALAAEILSQGKQIGFCGQLVSTEARRLDAAGAVLLAEIDVAQIAQRQRGAKRFEEMERFPAVRRDIAMFVAPAITHEQVMQVITASKEPLLERAELFDLFSEKGTEVSAGNIRKSLAYSLTYRAKNRTLTSEEVNAAHTRIRERLRKEIEAQLRE